MLLEPDEGAGYAYAALLPLVVMELSFRHNEKKSQKPAALHFSLFLARGNAEGVGGGALHPLPRRVASRSGVRVTQPTVQQKGILG